MELDRQYIAKEAQDAAEMGQMKTVYEATRKLCKGFPKKIGMVKDKNGNLLTDEHKIRDRWKEHFTEVLNIGRIQRESPKLTKSKISERTKAQSHPHKPK